MDYRVLHGQGEFEVLLRASDNRAGNWYLVKDGVTTIATLRQLLGKQVKVVLSEAMVVQLEPL